MLTKKIFDLSNYFGLTNKYYYFFDGLFKIKNESKLEILENLNIPSSTYRKSRKDNVIKNDNHLILLKYFGISEKLGKLEEYEQVINELFSNIYYKNNQAIEKYSKMLERYIEDNNYLKPIFTLFRILVKIVTLKETKKIFAGIKDDIDYLCYFTENYFEKDFKIIYRILLYFAGRSDACLKDYSIDNKYPHLSWLYHHLRASFNYYSKNYAEAILYYTSAMNFYLRDINIKRVLDCQLNIGAMYNYIHAYKDALNKLSPLVEYAVYQTTDIPLRCYSIMHYFIALLQIDAYDEIMLALNNWESGPEIINDVSAMVGIIASYKTGVKEKMLKESLNYRIEKDVDVKSIFDKLYHKIPLPNSFNEGNIYFYLDLIKTKVEIC